MELINYLETAYKKLKGSVYYDNSQVITRNQIVRYESLNTNTIRERFLEIEEKLTSQDNEQWDKYQDELLDSIKALAFPKKIKKEQTKVVMNTSKPNIEISEVQNYFNINVEGQILGVLWVLLIGVSIDAEFYANSYGNRLRKNLFNEKKKRVSFTPYLFQTYFSQYENWRDKALDSAQICLESTKDVIILTMDFKRFFYNINMHEEDFNTFYKNYADRNGECLWVNRVNTFVFEVIKRYSALIQSTDGVKRNILPIGFYPSNILSNYCLNKFDDAVIDRWSPVYYGRYVDDIMIVDKVEENSWLYNLAKDNILTEDDVIQYYLCNCNAEKGKDCMCKNNRGLLQLNKNENGENEYQVNPAVLNNKDTKIIVSKEKVKVFYFKAGGSRALLNCFRNDIAKNVSEFRLLPEEEVLMQNDDYGEIYSLKKSDTINKLHGVDGISIDKYSLSKLLGKHLRIGGLITDKLESNFEKDLLKIFDSYTVIENYATWEKVLAILVINSNFDMVLSFVEHIMKTVRQTEINNDTKNGEALKESLLLSLYSSLCRTLSLNWCYEAKKCIEKICDFVENNNWFDSSMEIIKKFNYDEVLKYRRGYCFTLCVRIVVV